MGDLSIVNAVGYEDCKLEISAMLKNILKDNHDGETITAAVTSLGNIYPGNIDIMNRLLHKIKANKSEHNYISDLTEDRINKIAYQNTYFINHLIELLNRNNHYKNPLYINILSKISLGNFDTVKVLINLMNNSREIDNYWLIRKTLIQILKGDLFAEAVSGLKDRYINKDEEDQDILHILWHCAQNMTYPEFYRAWHGNTPTIQNLENQFTDTHSLLTQLQPTTKTYPLPLNLKNLQNETDIIEISQEICNQIYLTAFTAPEEIPTVINAPQLKSKIPQIKKHLKTENLALIINNCEANETIINFCNKLTDVLHIAFITEQPLNPPLRGFPQQQNLLNTIQNWINEIE
ncbi:MAG: hypothetical protein ACKO9I_03935 [Sphaerospermopsis kisseleviana]